MVKYNELYDLSKAETAEDYEALAAANAFLEDENERLFVEDLLKDRRKVDEFIIENMRELKKDIRDARNEIGEVKADVQMVSTALSTHATDEMKLIIDIKSKHKDAIYGMTEEQHANQHRDIATLLREREAHKEDTRKIVVDTKTKITWVIVVAFGLGLLALTDKYIDTNHAQANNQAVQEMMEKTLKRFEENRREETINPKSMRQP